MWEAAQAAARSPGWCSAMWQSCGQGVWWPSGNVPRLAHWTAAEVTRLPGTPALNWSHSAFHWSKVVQGAFSRVWNQLYPVLVAAAHTCGCIAACASAPVELPCWAWSRRPASDLWRKTHGTKQPLLHSHPLTLQGHSQLYNAWQIFPSRSRSCLPV